MDYSAFVGAAAPLRVAATARSTICMSADDKPVVSRRAALTGAAAAALAAVAGSLPALAETEYANVPFLGGSDIIDINNANVRAYAKYPGMYPTVAGIIATNGPFESVSDLFKIPGLTDLQIATLKKYQDKLVALTPTPEYVRFSVSVSCCVWRCLCRVDFLLLCASFHVVMFSRWLCTDPRWCVLSLASSSRLVLYVVPAPACLLMTTGAGQGQQRPVPLNAPHRCFFLARRLLAPLSVVRDPCRAVVSPRPWG